MKIKIKILYYDTIKEKVFYFDIKNYTFSLNLCSFSLQGFSYIYLA